MQAPKKMTQHEMRLLIYQKQAGLCWLCGEPLDLFLLPHNYGGCSFEHIVPRSSGGSDSWKNIALTHRECNVARRDTFAWSLQRPKTWKETHSRACHRKMQKRFERAVKKLRPLFERAWLTEP
jgi:5-methylcytosine-specific restriction endonuclease McrA